MAESPNFDSLDKEEKELIEKLERIKREKEELKKKKEVICHVSEFNPLNGNAGLKLSDSEKMLLIYLEGLQLESLALIIK
jgi:hypothetical protein